MDDFQQSFVNQLNEQAKPKPKRDLRLPIAAGIVILLVVVIAIGSLISNEKEAEVVATSNEAALKFFNYLITCKEEGKELPEYDINANYCIETAIYKEDAKDYLKHAEELSSTFIESLNMKEVSEGLKFSVLEQSENIKFLEYYINHPVPNVKSVYDAEKLDNKAFAKKYLNVMSEDWAKENEIPVVKDYIAELDKIGSEYADRYIGFYYWSIRYDLYTTALKLDKGCPGIACSMNVTVSESLTDQAKEFYSDMHQNQLLCATVTATSSYEIMEKLQNAN